MLRVVQRSQRAHQRVLLGRPRLGVDRPAECVEPVGEAGQCAQPGLAILQLALDDGELRLALGGTAGHLDVRSEDAEKDEDGENPGTEQPVRELLVLFLP
jgi:hypothetical protein